MESESSRVSYLELVHAPDHSPEVVPQQAGEGARLAGRQEEEEPRLLPLLLRPLLLLLLPPPGCTLLVQAEGVLLILGLAHLHPVVPLLLLSLLLPIAIIERPRGRQRAEEGEEEAVEARYLW